MGKKTKPKLGQSITDLKELFNSLTIQKPNIEDPALMNWIQKRLDEVRSTETVATDGPRGQAITLTETQKEQIVSVLDIGLSIATRGNRDHLETIAERGRFLCEVERFLKAAKLRIFRAFCSWCGWKKSSAYNWIKIFKAYGENLKDCVGFSERQLLICSALKDPMEFLDANRDAAVAADEAELKKMVVEAGAPRPKSARRGTSKVVIGTFCYTQRKDRATISGLSSDQHQEIQNLLEKMSGESVIEKAEVSSTLDTCVEIETAEDSENGNDAPPENAVRAENTFNPAGILLISQFPESLSNAHAQA